MPEPVAVPEPVEGTLHRGFDKLNHQKISAITLKQISRGAWTYHSAMLVAVPKPVAVPEPVEGTLHRSFDKLNHPETPQPPPHLRRK